MRLLFLLTALFIFSANFQAQNVSNNYFDGQIYLRLSGDYKFQRDSKSDEIQPEQIHFLKEFIAKYGIRKIRSSFYFSQNQDLRNTWRLYFDEVNKINELLSDLNRLPEVLYCEPVPLHRKSITPNDLGANNTGGSGQWSLWKIFAQQAWDISLGNSNVAVAVVDDAVQTTHPDLVNVCLPGRDVTDQDNNPNPPDNSFDHGTHVAGIIGAQTNNGTGIASIGFGVSILPVKATNEVEFITDGYEGVVWAIENGADVINMSWGGGGGSQTGQNIMDYGYNLNVVLVAAAGNDDVSDVFYPAGFDHVISVASTSSSDAKSGFSNFGSWIDISAPGSSIRSTLPPASYGLKSGTSMASPLVAGLCGLMRSANALLTPDEVLSCLQESADNINSVNQAYIGQLGAGRINAEAALICANLSAADYDASVSAIISPSASTCETGIQPIIVIRNNGQVAINSLQITVELDGVNLSAFQWTGNLTSQSQTTVNLPVINTTIGNHVLEICSGLINGNQTDVFGSNNCKTLQFAVITPNGAILPFIETFESGNFSANGWTVVNNDNASGWETTTIAGTTPGNTAARIPFYSYNSVGQRDALITPAFDFSAYSAIQLSFEHAYRRYEAGYTDSLIVSVSTDCGLSFPFRIFTGGENGTGSFATQTISTDFFTPASGDDWCSGPVGADCAEINLNQFAGLSGVRIKFEGYNNYGNNLYLDNINISGDLAGFPATANFTVANGNQVVCAGGNVQFTNLSGNLPTAYNWSFPGGTPASSQAVSPSVTYSSPGVYQVSLTASNQFGSDTEVKNAFIEVVAGPALGVSVNPPATCAGTPVSISASGATSYAWSPSVAISSSTGASITANPPQTTTYQLSGTNAQGCTSVTNFTVQVYQNPAQEEIQVISPGVISAPAASAYQWYLNGSPITGAVSQEYSPQQSGNYTVEVFNQFGCSTISFPLNFDSNILSLQPALNNSLDIFPNPATEYIRISNADGICEFKLVAVDGKLVKSGLTADGLIHLNDLSEGIYQLVLINNNQLHAFRLVILSH